ncbi:MAG: tRNA uridine-5-carboxymethylaminomethyl(34) synthesis GTPase MnmE [Verrucomicrobiae bacterium]|nr:tRNA uridine-5-carboxymethylaminomethyl(34) synthesis GTPase MnmE [Verrucomicrobiae bacterium]
MPFSTIAAIASPPGTGAVALIRISGAAAKLISSRVFKGRSSSRWEPRRQHFGSFVNFKGEKLDEGLLTWFPGPDTFTGEDVVELACHGGALVTRRVLEALWDAGAVPAESGEFSQRSFFNGRMDLTQAEAIMDLITAQTDLAIKAAGEQLEGRLGREIEAIRQHLVGILAQVEAHIDFPDEDIEPSSVWSLNESINSQIGLLNRLLATADQGRLLREGLRTVICGPPNAGKSSLLNALLGSDRAIVSDQAGTTRDTIEEVINLKGIPLRLVDTAGIRENAGSVERQGIDRSRAQIAKADLVLLVVDASVAATGLSGLEVPDGTELVRVFNKSDLPLHADWEGKEGVTVSCLEELSVEALKDHLYRVVTAGNGLEFSNLTAINARHQYCLRRAIPELEEAVHLLAIGESPEFVANRLHAALDAVGEVVGKTDVEEILGEIFSQFCIGK